MTSSCWTTTRSVRQTPEFASLPGWWKRLAARAEVGRAVGGFVPILQAFGGAKSPRGFARRLPTAAEERYMDYAALEAGATGIFFWAWYRSDSALGGRASSSRSRPSSVARWRRCAPRSLETSTSVDRRDVGLTMFCDPRPTSASSSSSITAPATSAAGVARSVVARSAGHERRRRARRGDTRRTRRRRSVRSASRCSGSAPGRRVDSPRM